MSIFDSLNVDYSYIVLKGIYIIGHFASFVLSYCR